MCSCIVPSRPYAVHTPTISHPRLRAVMATKDRPLLPAAIENGPEQFPGASPVARGFPVPHQTVSRDVVKHHAIHDAVTGRERARLRDQDHPAVLERAGQRDVAALTVDPGLVPL